MCEYCWGDTPGSPNQSKGSEEMQDNLALQIIDEQFEEGFKIDNDGLAEWALKKIAEEQAESQRYINVCDTMIAEYTRKRQKAQEQLETKTAYLKQKLQEYFATVPHKATKTQETYKLPSGTLKLKLPSVEFVRDDTALVEWLKNNGYGDKVKIKESPDWAEFKKLVTVSFDKVLTADGEIVEGVTVQEKPSSFEVEI
jgi:phage host-nuclease inhibitor protein Gam